MKENVDKIIKEVSGTRPSGNVASHGNGGTSAAHGTFGGRR